MIKKILHWFGIDKAIGFTVMARIIQGLGGIVSVFLIARYLTGIEQGFYYTFASILAIQIFFELGLGGIITQYVAHENSHLQWNKSQQVEGESKYISRLASLLRFCLQWYSALAGVLFIILLIGGGYFFCTAYKSEQTVNWILPWLMLCIGTTCNFLIAPISAFLEGLGRVKEIAQYRFYAQFVMLSITWSGLILGAKLYVGGIASIIGALMFAGYLLLNYHRQTINTLLKIHIKERVNYKNEIFPYQWKIALSWVSGYFVFQLFNPILFITEGAIVAGQMGMTLTIINSIFGLSFSWMSTKTPIFSSLIAQKQYNQLDILFNKTLKQSLVVLSSLLILLLMTVFTIRYFSISTFGFYFGDRLLPYTPLFFIIIAVFFNQFTSCWAIYLRCHKQEPLMAFSLVTAILCILSTIILGRIWGLIGITAGYCSIIISMTPWGHYIFIKNKISWHNEHK